MLRALSILLLSSFITKGATITAASGSYSDVNIAVGGASFGDTVVIPQGTNSWGSKLVVSGITLQGSGSNNTVIIDESSFGAIASTIQISVITNAPTRVTQIQFRPPVTNAYGGNFNGMITVYGGLPYWRLDHCLFNGFNNNGAKCILLGDNSYGLIDQNMFIGANHQYIECGDVGYGDLSWSLVSKYGTTNAIYIESNIFNDSANFGSIDVANGGRVVFRYNASSGFFLNTHGTETGQRYRACRYVEVYNNYFYFSNGHAYGNFYTACDIRGGTALIFSNTFYGYNSSANVNSYRATDNDPTFIPWFGATGISGYDSNSPVVLAGNASATSNKLYVASAAWTINQWLGYTAYNSNRVNGLNLCGIVISSDAKTMTFKGSRTAAYQLYFTNGDSFSIHMAYPQIDQIGRGAGDLLSNATPVATWSHQALEPMYMWSNSLIAWYGTPPTYGDPPVPNTISASINSPYPNVVVNRDYYNNTPRPGYTPLVYPYPGTFTPTTNFTDLRFVGKVGQIGNF